MRERPREVPAEMVAPSFYSNQRTAATFLSRLCDGAGSLPDSIAALIFRLAARVTRLEQTTSVQADKIRKLEKQPRPDPDVVRTYDSRVVKTGLDVDGHPVRIEERVRRPVGRPKGRRDAYQRHRRPPSEAHHEPAELGLLDPDWNA